MRSHYAEAAEEETDEEEEFDEEAAMRTFQDGRDAQPALVIGRHYIT